MPHARRTAALAFALAAALGALAGGGCKPQRTQLVVWLDTDIPTCRLPDLRLRCGYDWDGIEERSNLACLYEYRRGCSEAELCLPGSFGVLTDESRPDDELTIVIDDHGTLNAVDEATGARAAGTLRRIVRVVAPQGRQSGLNVVLNARCAVLRAASASHPCPPRRASCTVSESCESQGQTCGNDGTCRRASIVPNEFVPPAPDARAPTALDSGGPNACATVRTDAGADARADAAADSQAPIDGGD